MAKRRVQKEDLPNLLWEVVRVDGEKENWKVYRIEGEICFCRKPYVDVGTRKEEYHFSKLSFAPAECEGKVCSRGCVQVP